MLKGSIDVYQFLINSNDDTDSITEKLNQLIYKQKSSIELFEKKQGGSDHLLQK